MPIIALISANLSIGLNTRYDNASQNINPKRIKIIIVKMMPWRIALIVLKADEVSRLTMTPQFDAAIGAKVYSLSRPESSLIKVFPDSRFKTAVVIVGSMLFKSVSNNSGSGCAITLPSVSMMKISMSSSGS